MTSLDESARRYRRRRLLMYRPSSNDSPMSPQHQHDPRPSVCSREEPRTLNLASPMERESRRILSVELRDIAQEVEQLQMKTPPCERSDAWSIRRRLSPAAFCNNQDFAESSAVRPKSTEEPSQMFPTLKPAPKEEVGWGLVPLFHSVRSKLESFAEIFLTPVKSRKDVQRLENGGQYGEPQPPECSASGEVFRGSAPPSAPPSDLPSALPSAPSPAPPSAPSPSPAPPSAPSPAHPSLEEEGGLNDGEDNAHHRQSPPQPQKTLPNTALHSGTSPSPLCRPPLQRYLSCPLPPATKLKRRHSLDTVECSVEPCSCRRRRHSLGSLEEGQSVVTFSLSCLRKENHPSVLRMALCPPGDGRPSVLSEGSAAGCYLDQDRVQGLSGAGGQVTAEADFKSPENTSPSKENKVSNIQIRKRTQRSEEKLTPLGLPKRVRLQKEDFSLEEIYTNKNYHTPTEKRKFETIFEEPIMRDGALILTSQRPLRRIMIFKDRTSAPRKRKRKGKVVGRTRRHKAASTAENINYELLLQHKLKQLEAALQEEPRSEP